MIEPRIDPTAFVHPDATIVGDVEVGAESTIWPHAVLRGDLGPIRVGARTSVQDGTVVVPVDGQLLSIGAECVIGHLVRLEGCTVGDRSLVGSGSTVRAGAVIETGSLVGAGALVPEAMVVPSRAMALGAPAVIKPDRVDLARDVLHGVHQYVGRSQDYREHLHHNDDGTFSLRELTPAVDPSARIDPTATLIGDVRIGPDAVIGPRVVLRADAQPIVVGASVQIHADAVVHVEGAHPTIIGAGSVIGSRVHLEGCTLAPGTQVGERSVVLPPAVVEPGGKVAPHTVVPGTMTVLAHTVAQGIPARLA